MEYSEQGTCMTNTKRIEIMKRLVNEKEDQIRFLESGLFDEA